jgi:transcriptional regulator with XRE-family HTH domain
MLHVRKAVLGLSQAELATIARVSQGTVSKWEAGQLEPNRQELDRIRAVAIARGISWDDSWFFVAPAPAVDQAEAIS